MARKFLGFGFLLLALLTGPPPAAAQTVVASSGIHLAPPPASVVHGAVESDTHALGFFERGAVTLAGAVQVDATAPGTYTSDASLTGGSVEAGQKVRSFFVHFDPVGTQSVRNRDGFVTFDAPILGVIATTTKLNNSDVSLGAPGTTYPTGTDGLRGLEMNPDNFTISADRRTVSFSMAASTTVDQFRVLTDAEGVVPEPSALALFLPALGAAAILRRRKG